MWLFIICGINAILASFILFVYLLSKDDVSYIVPHTSSLLIIGTLIIGYFFYEENISKKKNVRNSACSTWFSSNKLKRREITSSI